MENLIFFVAIFVALELFESNWQKSDTFFGVLLNNYKIYKTGLGYYFSLNPTFVYSIFLIFYFSNFSLTMLSIAAMKFFDISTKLYLMQKIDEFGENSLMQIFQRNINMGPILRYFNAVVYPLLFVMG